MLCSDDDYPVFSTELLIKPLVEQEWRKLDLFYWKAYMHIT